MEEKIASRKREQEQNKEDQGATRKKLKYELIREDWGEQTCIDNSTPPGSSKASKEPTTDKGATVANKGAAQTAPPTPCKNKGGDTESSSATLKAPGSQESRHHLQQSSIRMLAVQRPPEPAGNKLRSKEGPISAEQRDTFADNAMMGDMGEEERDEEEDLTEEQRTSSENVGSLEEEQKKEKNTLTTTPSVVRCEVNRKGYCKTHQCQAEKRVIKSQVWKDRGAGRGFGYVSKKVTKYACMRRVNTIPQVSDAPVMGGLVISNNKKSRNLSEPGHDRNILTGFMGTCSAGFESENLLDQDGLPEEEKTGR